MHLVIGLVSAYLFKMMSYLIRMSPAAMEPELMKAFHYNAFGFSLMSASFYYAYALMQIPAGYVVDKYGIRTVFCLSAFLSVIGLSLQALTDLVLIEDLSRALLGAASSTIAMITVKIISQGFRARLFPLLFSVSYMLGLLGSLFALTPLTIMVNYFGFEHVLLLMAFVCAIILMLAWVFIRLPATLPEAQDISFKAILSQRNIWVCGIIIGLQSVPMSAFASLWSPTYFKFGFALDEVLATAYSQIFFIGAIFGSLFIGWLAGHFNLRKSILYVTSIIAFCACVYWLAFFDNLQSNVIALLLLGVVSINVVTTSILRDNIPSEYLGLAYGLCATVAQMISASSQILFGILLQDRSLGALELSDFYNPIMLLPLSLLVSLVFVYLIKDTAGSKAQPA